MPAFQAEPGMPYWIDLTSSDVRKSSHFYSQVLGWEIEEISEGYRMARLQGLPVAGLVQRPEAENQPDTWVTYFQSDNIDHDCERVVELGGRVLVAPVEVRLGQLAVLVDTAGSVFGLIQPAGEDSFIAAGEPGTPVWHELTATVSYGEAVEFYEQLFGWVTATTDAQDYTPPRWSMVPRSPESSTPPANSRPTCRVFGRPSWGLRTWRPRSPRSGSWAAM